MPTTIDIRARLTFFIASLFVIALASGCAQATTAPVPSTCSSEQFNAINAQLATGDGHGPDVGSEEWQSAMEFKLGLRGNEGIPKRSSAQWCAYISDMLSSQPSTTAPSFNCANSNLSSAATLVCEYGALARLDNQLNDVYFAALNKADAAYKPTLKAMQRGWIKGRDECWKASNPRHCVTSEYERRITALQAQYRLVDNTGPVFFYCDDNPANEIVVTFFDAYQPVLIAERGDSQSLMFIEPSASGKKYVGPNETFWEHNGEATVTWGYNAAEMRCKRTTRK